MKKSYKPRVPGEDYKKDELIENAKKIGVWGIILAILFPFIVAGIAIFEVIEHLGGN